MKQILLLAFTIIISTSLLAQNDQRPGFYTIPDSVKATGFITDVIMVNKKDAKRTGALINVNNQFFLGLSKNKSKKKIIQLFNQYRHLGVSLKGIPFNWDENKTYKLLVLIAGDSATKTSIVSGYIFLPDEQKWKMVESKIFKSLYNIHTVLAESNDNKKYASTFSNRWLLRSNNTWKALDSQTTKPPMLRPMSNIDSAAQQKIEEDNLIAKLPKDSVTYKEGIFYQHLKEGTGKLVNLTDTVVIFYKGWLFSDGSVFDETKDKPATFPLSRLIRGWQIGVPQCKVGGKIRLFIPSGSAYGIRTFATDIPPNNTLVFDVEVVEVKEKVEK
jgi:FKBP-type peptidyl-prolyl cis-trans isomerase FkpA